MTTYFTLHNLCKMNEKGGICVSDVGWMIYNEAYLGIYINNALP